MSTLRYPLLILWLMTIACGLAGHASFAAEPARHIAGRVTSERGPEAGVWVIAETSDLKTEFSRIVVTNDDGRFVVPDLPKAKYRLWVRGYGLRDSKSVEAALGQDVALSVSVAKTAAEAAEIYPANYWFSLIRPPAANTFAAKGASTSAAVQQDWMATLKEECINCHPVGDTWTRNLPGQGDPIARWAKRLAETSGPNPDPYLEGMEKGQRKRMTDTIDLLGRDRSLAMFADWTTRIEKGELPAEAPPRPTGVERNLVLTLWGWSLNENGIGAAVHDEVSTDKRNPTVNANGPVFGTQYRYGRLAVLDPKTHVSSTVDIPGFSPPIPHRVITIPHNPMFDQKGRVWSTIVGPEGTSPSYCLEGKQSPFAQYFPRRLPTGRQIALYDPASGKPVELISTCFNTHHLAFDTDADNTVYFSGDTTVVGWFKTNEWDRSHDANKAQGWCPVVLDTNGDGKITPDSKSWNGAVGGEAGGGGEEGAGKVAKSIDVTDPTKDTQITGFPYGVNVDYHDHSVWSAIWRPSLLPSGISRMEVGSNPPQTCKAEYYEPPRRPDGTYAAYNGRGVEVDSKGVVWIAYGSGQLGRFDRRKCKVLNGPTATGQHCPQGWSFYDMPGPKIAGVADGTADWPYLIWLDLHNILGLGHDVPVLPGNNSDSLLALDPQTGKWTVMRVPYPHGLFPRGLDGRIDDPKAGWKGRGLWAAYGMTQNATIHIEGTMPGRLVKVQLRPDPLAQ